MLLCESIYYTQLSVILLDNTVNFLRQRLAFDFQRFFFRVALGYSKTEREAQRVPIYPLLSCFLPSPGLSIIDIPHQMVHLL